MMRSGGVTAAAIVLFFGSGLLVLFMGLSCLMLVLPQPANVNPAQQYQAFIFGLGLYGILAAWGIATAVGVLRLRNWARISILVMAGFAITCLLMAVVSIIVIGPMMSKMPGMNATAERVFLVVFSLVAAFPIGISIWWLVLFMRRRVVAEFEGKPFATSSGALDLSPVFAGSPASPVAIGTGERITAAKSGKIPVSITVIAVFLLFGAVFLLPSTIHAFRWHIPFIILGVFIGGAKALAVLVALAAIQLLLGLALLFKRAWSLNATIAYAIFALANGVLFLVSSSRDTYFNAIFQSYQTPPNLPPDFFPQMMHSFMPLIMGFAVAVNLVALYFLWTRRAAYRAACAAR